MQDRVDEFARMRAQSRRITQCFLGLLAGAAVLYFAVLRLPEDVALSDMVAGFDMSQSRLECWLTLEFEDYPADHGLRDLRVVFRSEALRGEQSFDWEWIAANDYVGGEGMDSNERTVPEEIPPLGEVIKVKFPLDARSRIRTKSDRVALRASVYWAGIEQDRAERALSHVYHSGI